MFTFNFNDSPEIRTADGKKVKTDFLHDCGIFEQKFSNEFLDGRIVSYKTVDKILFLLLDFQAHKSTEVLLQNSRSLDQGLHLFYNAGYMIKFKRQDSDRFHKVEKSQLCISLPSEPVDYHMCFPQGERVKAVLIQTNFAELIRENFCVTETLPEKLDNALNGTYAERIQRKELSLAMQELINKCYVVDYDGLERRMSLEAYCKELTAMAIGTIGRYKSSQNGVSCLSTAEREAVHQAAEILEREFTNPPLQRALAKRVGLNLNKLSLGFQDIYGVTINKYVLRLKLEKAKSMLSNGSRPTISTIAGEVGFNNTSYFIRKFREAFGETPGEYV